jgi:hypothetical protein
MIDDQDGSVVLSIRQRLDRGSRPAELAQDAPKPALEFVNKPQEVEFAGYAEDCRIFGFWRHEAERLSDALNANEEFLLHDVLLAALEDGRTTDAREFLANASRSLRYAGRARTVTRLAARGPVYRLSRCKRVHTRSMATFMDPRALTLSGRFDGASQWCPSRRRRSSNQLAVNCIAHAFDQSS